MPTTLSTKEQMPADNKKETVEINKEDYKSLLNRITKLEKGIVDDSILDRPAEHFVGVRMMDDKYVIDYGKPFEKITIKGEPELWIYLLLLDTNTNKEEKVEIRYLEFIKSLKQVKAKIIEKSVKEKVETQGYVTKKNVDGYKTVDTGVKVPARVISPEASYLVEIEGVGHQLTLKEKAIN